MELSCARCGVAFTDAESVRNHEKTVHPNTEARPAPVRCEQCGSLHPSERAMREHMRADHSRKRSRDDVLADALTDLATSRAAITIAIPREIVAAATETAQEHLDRLAREARAIDAQLVALSATAESGDAMLDRQWEREREEREP